MDINEAIKHCESCDSKDPKCREEHQNLADWLKELLRLREFVDKINNYYDEEWIKFKAKQLQEKEVEVCEWKHRGNFYYDTGCGVGYGANTAHCKYCQFCGKKIKEVV